jgi:hypothetical protein
LCQAGRRALVVLTAAQVAKYSEKSHFSPRVRESSVKISIYISTLERKFATPMDQWNFFTDQRIETP